LAADGELKGVRVIAVSVDGKLATLRAHLKKHPLPFTVAWDPEFGEKVGTQHVPITLLIDAKGVVRDGWTGFGEGPIQKLKAAIDACRE
jgi:peroxiredoxin